jgi:hypothetical protein
MSPLLITTLVVNYSGLAAAIWLGWFVLTRSPRRLRETSVLFSCE